MSLLLAIETSCDETGVALVRGGRTTVANDVASQIDVHRAFGGVVPEIASRQHTLVISQMAQRVLEKADGPIAAVAATIGPGLMGSLLVGVSFAKSLAYAWGVPFVPVHHLEGHLYSVFLDQPEVPTFPFLALIVSGGHTCLVRCPKPLQYEFLGTTRDDAVGECFDKAARLLGLPYPGGPSIQKAAEGGDPHAFSFPRGLSGQNNLEFSYSGLKTALLYTLRDVPDPLPPQTLRDLAASFQWAAVDVLVEKTRQALAATGAQELVLAGGVAANKLLRERLEAECPARLYKPPMALCVDNGAMIGAAGAVRLEHGHVGAMTATPCPGLGLA